jgi:hypothetical protein
MGANAVKSFLEAQMMEDMTLSRTFNYNAILIRLIAREGIAFSYLESFRFDTRSLRPSFMIMR